MEQFSDCLQWNNRILNDREDGTREDIQVFAWMMDLVLLFEMDEVDLFGYRVRACKRHLQKREEWEGFGMWWIRLLESLVKLGPDTSGKAQALAEAKQGFVSLQQGGKIPSVAEHKIRIWLESRIQGKPMHSFFPLAQ